MSLEKSVDGGNQSPTPMRHLFIPTAVVSTLAIAAVGTVWTPFLWTYAVLVPLILIGIRDMTQTSHAVLRNFPVLGHMRYLLELIRPEINQYFVESNHDGRPFSREERSIVYQRAKMELATLPFGTQQDVTAVGYEWINHSMYPSVTSDTSPRITIGSSQCAQPYSASIFNISAMSYG